MYNCKNAISQFEFIYGEGITLSGTLTCHPNV